MGAYSFLNFERILHSVFLKFSLFVINLSCPNFACVKLATCADTVLGVKVPSLQNHFNSYVCRINTARLRLIKINKNMFLT